jgi:hypothetical protein
VREAVFSKRKRTRSAPSGNGYFPRFAIALLIFLTALELNRGHAKGGTRSSTQNASRILPLRWWRHAPREPIL